MSKFYNKVLLGSIAEFSYGYTATAQDVGNTRFIRITDIAEDGSLKEHNAKFIDFSSKLERYQVEKGDLLVARTGGTFGKTLFYRENHPAIYASFLIKITLNKEYLLSDFYFHFSQSKGYWFQAKNLVTGGAQPQFNANILKEIVVPLPPLSEQKAISALLGTWDRAIEKTQALITAKEEQFQWLLQELVTSADYPRRYLKHFIKEISSRNKNNKVERILSITNRIGFILPEKYFERRIASSSVKNYKIITRGQYAYNPSRINVGSIARLDQWEEGILSPMYIVFSIKKNIVDSDYFSHWLSSYEAKKRIKNSTQGSVRETVSFSDLGKISCPLPPLGEQHKIAAILNTAWQEIDLLKKMANKYKEQKKGLMQKLLTGIWRIKKNVVQQYEEKNYA